jgi:glycerophosphoryl diester phosphodiesterase
VQTLIEKQTINVRQGILHILGIFRHNWKLFLVIHIAVSVFSLLALAPLLSLVMGWLVLISGQTALADEDILLFVLSPAGLPVMLFATALYISVLVFEQAAMIVAGRDMAAGRNISFSRLGRQLLLKSWPLVQLTVQMITWALLFMTPFVLVCAWVYFTFLGEFDINYYLAYKPPVLWWSGGVMLVCLLFMCAVLLRAISAWVLALPLLLLNNVSPAQALRTSRKAAVAMRWPIVSTLLVVFLFNSILLALVSSLADFAVDGVMALAGESLELMAYILGALLVVWLLSNFAITFFGSTMLSLAILYMYRQLIRDPRNKYYDPVAVGPVESTWKVPAKSVLAAVLITSLVAGLGLSAIIGNLELDDDTLIIAHRGASADAPENTLAAIKLAIENGADQVELDVQETAEGQVVVIHDSDMKRVAGSGMSVYETPLSKLQSLDIGSWMDASFSDQRTPTLLEALNFCRDRIKVIIELKHYGRETKLEERVVGIVEAAGMQEQVEVMSLSYPAIQKVKSMRPEWKVGYISSVAIGDLTRLEADFFAVNANFANRRFIRHIHKRNQKVLVWTVNDAVSISAMMSKGVDGIITDKPALAARVKKERAELEIHERLIIQVASFIGKQPSRPQQ